MVDASGFRLATRSGRLQMLPNYASQIALTEEVLCTAFSGWLVLPPKCENKGECPVPSAGLADLEQPLWNGRLNADSKLIPEDEQSIRPYAHRRLWRNGVLGTQNV